ncbi:MULTISPECIES: hypothetical protein [Crocosphaera]|uniref:Uncharacterized protein n=3 Tax=Crocosphaera watsonii TaxID=263511 RepID=T2K070_CROWT|nr:MULTISPECIES: hypothetical protein [Crocosphaera]MCH2245240.1 V-type ATPase subunit a family protein [Crocosphaera sp.]NQZ63627.1 transposase [Crocosphaera sp.]CCQ70771.1 hypothetical protein CWATWH0402_4357 [Crocosphaera watsonii WH 0402]
MSTQLAIKARIAQIKASGPVADPNTWIGYSTITKKGKKYTYYRLMKAVLNTKKPELDNSPKSKFKGKMAKYLGSKDSQAYKDMKKAIQRRNEIQRLERKLREMEKVVSEGQSVPRTNKQPSLTTLVKELRRQIHSLQAEFRAKIESLEQELRQQLSTVQV